MSKMAEIRTSSDYLSEIFSVTELYTHLPQSCTYTALGTLKNLKINHEFGTRTPQTSNCDINIQQFVISAHCITQHFIVDTSTKSGIMVSKIRNPADVELNIPVFNIL